MTGRGVYFLAKRSKLARDENERWDPGAGGLKHGYSLEDNRRRELKEEYGVEPLETEFVGYFDAFRTDPSGMDSHWLAMCCAVKVDPDQIKIGEPEMFDDSGWFDLDNLPSPLHSQFPVFLEKHGVRFREILGKSKR